MENNSYGRRSLPVLKIIVGAFSIMWQRKAAMLRALAFLILVLTLINYASTALYTAYKGLLLTFFVRIFKGLAFTMFAVICHRLVLLGDGSVPKYGLLRWSPRETRFLGWTIAAYFWFSIITLLISTPLALFSPSMPSLITDGGWGQLLSYVLVLPRLYVFCRLSILLPATAVDEPHSFTWAWELTEGNGWRLLLVIGILPMILKWGQTGYSFALMGSPFLKSILYIVGYVCIIIEIAALSLSFRFLRTQAGPLIYDEVKKLLLTAAQKKQLVDQGQIAKLIWQSGNNHATESAKSILYEIGEEAHRLKQPMLSAIVVDQNTGKPDADFFILAQRLNKLIIGASIQQRDIFWQSEREAVFTHDWTNDGRLSLAKISM